jgi:hypothetical protein
MVHSVGRCLLLGPAPPGATCPVAAPVKGNLFLFASCCAAASYKVKRNLFPVLQILHGQNVPIVKRCAAMT